MVKDSALARIPTVAPEVVLDSGATVIDLRSPSEFAADHIPGAVNVALFDDEERAIIGTLYRQHSPQAAFERGADATERKISSLVARIAEVAGWELPGLDLRDRLRDWTAGGIEGLQAGLEVEAQERLPSDAVVLHCWRGGLRSRSVAAFVRALGLESAVALTGGYKAYRAHVLCELEQWVAPPAFVLRGLTGVGKTLVLREIEARLADWTLDLEALAGHRSSVLGMVGLEPCTQKTFDTRLAARLRRGFPGPCVVEGESRKVGDVILPPRVWQALELGTAIELVADTERRVDVLVADYLADESNRTHLARQLPFIERRLGSSKWKGELVKLLETRRERELVALLLEKYYDPLYRHSEGNHEYGVRIDAGDPQRAAQDCIAWIEERLPGA